MIVAVTGLEREARLVAGLGVEVLVGGGDAGVLEERLSEELARCPRRVISVGICGALSPNLQVGDAVIATEVIDAANSYPTHAGWSRDLQSRLPFAIMAPLAGADAISADRRSKALLRAETRASAVDMESHIAGRVASRFGLPFAALRVVSDAAHRTLPAAAAVGMDRAGQIDFRAVLQSILRGPLQLPALVRTAWEAEIAFATLFRCRHALAGGFAGADLGKLAVDMG